MKKVFLIAVFAAAATLGVSSQNEVQGQSDKTLLPSDGGNEDTGGIKCNRAKNTCYVVSTFTGDIVVKGVLTITL